MKTTFLALLTFILLVGCTTEETNEIVETSNAIIKEDSNTREAGNPYANQFECFDVFFDPEIHDPLSIQLIRDGYFADGYYWFAAPTQPDGYPYHQVWCRYLGHPGGQNGEDDPPTGVTIVPKGGRG